MFQLFLCVLSHCAIKRPIHIQDYYLSGDRIVSYGVDFRLFTYYTVHAGNSKPQKTDEKKQPFCGAFSSINIWIF